jgi:hypothetical protein
MIPPLLTADELGDLVRTVFAPEPERDRRLAILCDVPRSDAGDTPAWRDRRAIALEWARLLADGREALGFETVRLAVYPDVGSNNADLPAQISPVPLDVESLDAAERKGVSTDKFLRKTQIVLALTERSATAPLKVLARRCGFRAATLPGFTHAMLPALRLDFEEVSRRTHEMWSHLDAAEAARLELHVGDERHVLDLDLRHREPHASDGLIREPGMAANLPSGEAYIVPYEGERIGQPSRSHGTLPVQLGDEVVVYRIEENRAVAVLSKGPASEREAEALRSEPAYGNVAELGLGVLASFGIQAVGVVLLDEKLGLHVAFGRSDHLGGVIAPSAFLDRARVVHVDRVYVPSAQPMIAVRRVVLIGEDGREDDVTPQLR